MAIHTATAVVKDLKALGSLTLKAALKSETIRGVGKDAKSVGLGVARKIFTRNNKKREVVHA